MSHLYRVYLNVRGHCVSRICPNIGDRPVVYSIIKSLQRATMLSRENKQCERRNVEYSPQGASWRRHQECVTCAVYHLFFGEKIIITTWMKIETVIIVALKKMYQDTK